MKKKPGLSKLLPNLFLILTLVGCATSTPKGFLKLPADSLEKRQLQTRQYDTKKDETIVTAVAAVLQDLGFTLDESETEVGFVAASKKANVKNAGQKTGAVFLTVLSALAGTYSNALATVDAVQHVKASVIVKPSLDGRKTVVRVTFQRIMWNASNQVNKLDTISDPEIYQSFFNSLSKSIFLEANTI